MDTGNKKKNFVPSKWSKMCNKHFLHSDYKQPPGGTYVLRLKDDAVPTVCLPSSSLPPVKIHVLDEVPNILENVNESGNSESNIVTTETNVVEDNSENEIPEVTLPILITPTKAKAIPTEQVTPVRKRKSVEITTPIRNMKNKIKVLQQKVRRQQAKINNMTDLFKEMKKKGLIDSDAESMMTNKFDGIFLELFKNQLKNKKRKAEGQRYSKEIKQFALTLNYYSPKAFNYCRLV